MPEESLQSKIQAVVDGIVSLLGSDEKIKTFVSAGDSTSPGVHINVVVISACQFMTAQPPTSP